MQPTQTYPIISSNPLYKFFPRSLKQYIQRGEIALTTLSQEMYKEISDWQFHSIELKDVKKRIHHSLKAQIERQLEKLQK